MIPPRVAQKNSVVSVESMAFLAPGPASAGTVPSWPDRRPGGRGAPEGGGAGQLGVWGGVGRGVGGGYGEWVRRRWGGAGMGHTEDAPRI